MPMRKKDSSQRIPNGLLSTNQVCERLGISRSKFYELIKIVPLEHYEFGELKRYDPYDLAAWTQKWKKRSEDQTN